MAWASLRIRWTCVGYFGSWQGHSAGPDCTLSKIKDFSTKSVRSEATFTVNVHSSLNYERAFKDYRALYLVDMRGMDTFNSMMTSSFLATNSTVIYVGYIRIGQKIMKHNEVTRLLTDLCKDGPTTMTLAPMYPEDPSISMRWTLFSLFRTLSRSSKRPRACISPPTCLVQIRESASR